MNNPESSRPTAANHASKSVVWKLAMVFAAMTAMCPVSWGGTWSALANKTPNLSSTNHGNPTLMMQLSDGTVLVENDPTGGGGSSNWFKLTPDIHGSYINGTWSILAPSTYTRAGCASDVLTNGNVFFAGGEYGTGAATAELYNPVSNVWSIIPVPTSLVDPSKNQEFSDAISEVLPNGDVLVAPVVGAFSHETMLYNPVANSFSPGPNLKSTYQDEASWVKLPDQSILTIDPFGTNTERYIPSQNQWITDAHVPVPLYSTNTGVTGAAAGEMGPAFLLPNGQAIFFGSTSNNAVYTPSGNTSPGVWTAVAPYPVIGTNIQGCPDAPAAMMVTGNVLLCTGTADTFNGPIHFLEYDYIANSFTLVAAPAGVNTNGISPYYTKMLVLPDGSVLWNYGQPQLYTYKPTGVPLAIGKPVISNITQNVDGSYHLVGTGLNGISEGAAYGDDAQMASNFPLIRMTNLTTGNVYYARSYNWSSVGVQTGSLPVSTEFALPATLPPGNYNLVVVANGISSDPASFVVPLPSPVIQDFSWLQTTLILDCTNIVGGHTYHAIGTTDITLPKSQWTPLTTNNPSSSGSFSFVINGAFDTNMPQQFFSVTGQ